ncbi:Uncharacterised protein [Bordetella pertussis]|nr:Uncharacterised protein [Bordetella pertussis]CFM10030.1 Uncharacterised protein [Bordetella pertussis]CFM70403.1 Uncharacterised protein [Bordetella pertussis]CFN88665.1 Uncharacterised protein [Bordetella pertussis]CFO70103.1 Uncharacterised protein [Bordetella pertussis]
MRRQQHVGQRLSARQAARPAQPRRNALDPTELRRQADRMGAVACPARQHRQTRQHGEIAQLGVTRREMREQGVDALRGVKYAYLGRHAEHLDLPRQRRRNHAGRQVQPGRGRRGQMGGRQGCLRNTAPSADAISAQVRSQSCPASRRPQAASTGRTRRRSVRKLPAGDRPRQPVVAPPGVRGVPGADGKHRDAPQDGGNRAFAQQSARHGRGLGGLRTQQARVDLQPVARQQGRHAIGSRAPGNAGLPRQDGGARGRRRRRGRHERRDPAVLSQAQRLVAQRTQPCHGGPGQQQHGQQRQGLGQGLAPLPAGEGRDPHGRLSGPRTVRRTPMGKAASAAARRACQ